MTVNWPSDALLARQRRSRIDWKACIPDEVATCQIAFERCLTVVAMRETGLSLQKVADFFEVSRERIRQMEARFRRRDGHISPVERYFGQIPELAWKSPENARQHNSHVIAWRRHVFGGTDYMDAWKGCSTPAQIDAARERDRVREYL